MKINTWSTILGCVVLSAVSVQAWTHEPRENHPPFDKNNDILIAQFDSLPDTDDVYTQAALGCMLIHPDLQGVHVYAVLGATGDQSVADPFISAATQMMELVYGPEGDSTWTYAWDGQVEGVNWNKSVTRVKNKVKPVLLSGGRVWVQEAGQSNITRDWLKALLADGVSAATIKNNVIVVQHSSWNEGATNDDDLNDVIADATYLTIDDGNDNSSSYAARDDTPGYRSYTQSFLDNATGAGNPNAIAKDLWTLAEQVVQTTPYNNPRITAGGVDFSDCVENWWIFDLESELPINNGNVDADIQQFWNRYVVNTPAMENIPPTVSYISPATDLNNLPAGSSISVAVNANDPDGSVAFVRLKVNGSMVQRDFSAPYEFGAGIPELENMAPGTYLLSVDAQDNEGAFGTVATRTVTVMDAPAENIPPTVAFISPATDLNNLPIGSSISIVVDAQDPDGSVEFVRLKMNGALVRRVFSAPYEFGAGIPELENMAPGTYLLSVDAQDNEGAFSTVATRTVTVMDAPVENIPPTVSYLLPATDLEGVPAGSTLSIVVDAHDPDGSVEFVRLKMNGALVRRVFSAPYEFGAGIPELENMAPGTYLLSVDAQDNDGTFSSVAMRTVTVAAPIVRYEAEAADGFEGTAGLDPIASGGEYIKFALDTGYIEWLAVDGGFGGEAAISFSTYCPRNTRSAEVFVNGASVGTITQSDVDWVIWDLSPVTLNPGLNNTIRIQAVPGSGALHVDYLEVIGQ